MADEPSQPFKFHGFQAPNYTQVPDELFDELLPLLSGGELKVLLYVIRRTFGFKKGSDRISKSQLENGITRKNGEQLDNGTGLSRRAVRISVDSLVEKNILLKHRHASTKNGDEATEYALNIAGRDPWVKSTPPGGGSKSTHGEGPKVPPQETVRQETVKVVNALPTNDQNQIPRKEERRPGRTQPTISDRALRATYALTDEQLAQVHYLVEKQTTLLGAADRNHGHYVKRAAEAIVTGTDQLLDIILGEFKQAATTISVKSPPSFFHAMWTEALQKRRAPLRAAPTDEPIDSPPFRDFAPLRASLASMKTVSTDDAAERTARLLDDATARGFPVPDYLRRSTYQAVASWWANLPERPEKSGGQSTAPWGRNHSS